MSTVDPGQGYRLLKEGEEIPSGAEVWACGEGPWMRVKESVGDTYYPVKDESGYHPMRRRLESPEAGPGIYWPGAPAPVHEAPESQPHTVHPWDALQALKDRGAIYGYDIEAGETTYGVTLWYRINGAGDWVDSEYCPTLSEAVQAAVEKLPVGVRQ